MNKGILLTDLHAGIRADSNIFLKSFENLFKDFLPEIIKKQNVSNIFILGDIFDNRNHLNLKTINLVLSTFKEFLSSHPTLEVYILIGNHDLFYKNTREINSLKILEDKFNNIHIISEVTRKKILNRDIVLCPWIIDKTDITETFKEPADVCLGHFAINGFEMIQGFKETEGLSQSDFDSCFKLTFSGHFHLRNEIGRIIYIGTPYQLSWNDCGSTKGVYVLDFDTLNYDFIEYTSAPKFKKIYLSRVKNKTIDIKKEICNNFIRLILDDNIESEILDKLNYIISGLNPLSFEVVDEEKSFGEVIISENSSGPVEFLDEYIEVMSLNDNVERDILKRKMNELFRRVEI